MAVYVRAKRKQLELHSCNAVIFDDLLLKTDIVLVLPLPREVQSSWMRKANIFQVFSSYDEE